MSVKYEILKYISSQFTDNIKIVAVFGVFGGQVLIVTTDDNAYSFGNCCFCSHGCLGLCKNSIHELTKVDELCGKQVANFAYGLNHVIAITKLGDTYSWGNNEFGQLGNGTKVSNKKPKLIKRLRGKQIAEVACGYYHSLALTQFGDVFAWGYNYWGQIGNGSNKDQLTPIKLRFGINKDTKIVSISCGCDHSLALTETGCVYSWGSNKYGQLGIGENRITEWTPVVVTIKDENQFIKSVICGQNHSLLLTLDGDMHAFGRNSGGQIGNGSYKEDQYVPSLVKSSHKFHDIAASIYCDISVALSTRMCCFVWGKCGDEVITIPREETLIKSMHDIFCYYAEPKVTYKPIVNCEENCSVVGKTLNDQQTSDVVFECDNQLIYAHKSILVIRCKYFRSLLSSSSQSSSKSTNTTEYSGSNGVDDSAVVATKSVQRIQLAEYSYTVYYTFLKYLYTYFIDYISLDDVIKLFDLANGYGEAVLKRKCEQLLVENISPQNVCTLYSTAIFYSSKVLEKHCLHFVANQLNSVCITDDFRRMDDSLCKKLFFDAAKYRLFK